jgi:carbonic anhydrase/acetyltransferase-like protein (isoleucine patch superfamily)
MRNNKPVVFLGAYLNLKRQYDFVTECGFEVAGVVDEVEHHSYLEKTWQGMAMLGHPDTFFNDLEIKEKYQFFVSMPFDTPTLLEKSSQVNWDRDQYIKKINELDLDCVTLIAPTAQVADTVILGKGVYIAGNCVVGNYTQIGDFTQINDNSIIGNHCTIGTNTNIQRLVTFIGHTVVGDNCIVGLHTLVANNYITIGDNAIIHSGFIIARNIEPGELIHLTGKTFKKIYKFHRVIN